MRWFLILLEFDFTVVVKKGITHMRVDHLSRLTTGEDPIGVPDDLLDAYLFNVDMIPEWSVNVVSLLTIGTLQISESMDANLAVVEKSKQFIMLARRLYRKGSDGVL